MPRLAKLLPAASESIAASGPTHGFAPGRRGRVGGLVFSAWKPIFVFVVCASLLAFHGRPLAAADTESLKQQIYDECPELRDGDLDDFSRVTRLRQWAWSHTPHSFGHANLLDDDPQVDWWRLDAAEIFELFEQDRGGVMCGGTALALQRLYEAFDYTAWSVNFGDPVGNATHVATLVKIRVDDGQAICVQDAYFNTTLVDAATNRPLDYFDLLGRLTRREHQTIRCVESDYRSLRYPAMIVAPADICDQPHYAIAVGSFSVLSDDYTIEELPDGSLKFISPRTFGKFVGQGRGFIDRYTNLLKKQGLPQEVAYLHLFPLGYSGPDCDAMLRTARAIVDEKSPSNALPPLASRGDAPPSRYYGALGIGIVLVWLLGRRRVWG